MKKFKNTRKELEMIGVDISTDAVRLLKLVRRDKAIVMAACAKVPYQETILVNALKEALEEIGGCKGGVAIALPDTLVIVKKCTLDATLTEKEISAWVSEEASRCLNLPSGALAIDFEIQADKNDEEKKVQWVAARKDEVHRKILLLEMAGVKVKIIDVNTFCLQRICKRVIQNLRMSGQVIGLAYFDKPLLSFVVVKGEEVLYTVTESYQCSSQGVYEESARALIQVINMFLSTSPGEKLNHIFLSGDFFSIKEIQDRIQISVSPVDVLSVFPKIEIGWQDRKYKAKKYKAHEFALSLGLAMRVNDDN